MRLIILGTGGYGRTVADVAAQIGTYNEILFLDGNSQARDVIGKCAEFKQFDNGDTCFYPAFGNNEGRLEWIYCLMNRGCKVATIVHQTAYVSSEAELKYGVVVLPHAIVNTACELKAGCIINCGAIVDQRLYP